jgi:xanthine dehydrogenase accessory factor
MSGTMSDSPLASEGPPPDEILACALRWREAGRPTAIATVLGTWGSSPRQPGSQLVVNDAREFVGSVSGGCVEGAVIEAALETIADGTERTLEFGVADEDAWAVGLACGGKVTIRVERVGAAEEEIFRKLLESRAQHRGAVLATRLGDGERTLLHPLEADAARASALHEPALRALLEDRSGIVKTPEGDVFLLAFNPPLRLVLIGAVHVAQALAPMASLAGFHVTVADPRRAFATEFRFPGVRLEHAWPQELLPRLRIDHRTAIVTLSHDAKLDDPALEAALKTPAFYVGALGSRRTHARRCERLREQGLTAEELERIHAPVGLDIGAVSPGEIAASILAQLVERTRRSAVAAAAV